MPSEGGGGGGEGEGVIVVVAILLSLDGAWLKLGDMDDYILQLDCYTSTPRKQFPGISISLLANLSANIISFYRDSKFVS